MSFHLCRLRAVIQQHPYCTLKKRITRTIKHSISYTHFYYLIINHANIHCINGCDHIILPTHKFKSMASLKIEQVDIYKLFIPLHEPFVISLGKVENAENIIVVIKTNEGITGFGECSPYLTINGESIDTCFIVGQYLAKVLKGKDPLDIKDCTRKMNRTIFGNSSIKSAFDIALHDIAS